jgi:hypothetical protein
VVVEVGHGKKFLFKVLDLRLNAEWRMPNAE